MRHSDFHAKMIGEVRILSTVVKINYLLEIPMNAPHALLQPGRIPRYVVIDHDPAELEIDAFAGSISTDKETSAALIEGLSESLHLLFALKVLHASMNLGDLPRVTHAAKSSHEEFERVAVLCEDDQFFAAEPRVRQDFPKFIEL